MLLHRRGGAGLTTLSHEVRSYLGCVECEVLQYVRHAPLVLLLARRAHLRWLWGGGTQGPDAGERGAGSAALGG